MRIKDFILFCLATILTVVAFSGILHAKDPVFVVRNRCQQPQSFRVVNRCGPAVPQVVPFGQVDFGQPMTVPFVTSKELKPVPSGAIVPAGTITIAPSTAPVGGIMTYRQFGGNCASGSCSSGQSGGFIFSRRGR